MLSKKISSEGFYADFQIFSLHYRKCISCQANGWWIFSRGLSANNTEEQEK